MKYIQMELNAYLWLSARMQSCVSGVFFFKVRFLEKYFYNSRIGKSSLSFYNFRMELLLNIISVSLESPLITR